MTDWRTVGVSLKESDVANLNLRLKQLGYNTLNEFVHAMIDGKVSLDQLSKDGGLADAIAEKIVNKLLTNRTLAMTQPSDSTD